MGANRLHEETPIDKRKGLASAKASGLCSEKSAVELDAGCRQQALPSTHDLGADVHN